jgi:hypothetical protein
MKTVKLWGLFCLCSAPLIAQVSPRWVSDDSTMMIVEGSGTGWTYGGGSWSAAGQTWMQAGKVNNPPASSAWAEADLGAFAGTSKYIYVMWHVNGPYRGHAIHYEIYDTGGVKSSTVVDETKHADGLALTNDTFSGWRLLGNRKTACTATTRLKMFKDASATSSEYMQSDAILLSDHPVISNCAPGSVNDFEYMTALSVNEPAPLSVGSHWGLQGLSEQFTFVPGGSAYARLDTSVYQDAPAGAYHVDVSWVYYNYDSMNVIRAVYSVNDSVVPGMVDQNRSASNQKGAFVAGNMVGTWSGFYRLPRTYPFGPSHFLKVSASFDDPQSVGYSLVWNMVRFVPASATSIRQEEGAIPADYQLCQNYPNPFNPSTVIEYTIAGIRGQGSGVSDVKLSVYDLLGREVAVLVNERKGAGTYRVAFDASKLASGVYMYRLLSGSSSITRTMLLLK